MLAVRETTHTQDFKTTFNGLLYSLLSWEQLAEFWSNIPPGAGWYIYAIGEALPLSPASPQQVVDFIGEIDDLLRRDHHEDYCGIVYTDDLERPSLIKIYDPNNLGVSCGSSKNPPLPGWVMSTMPPSELKPKGVVPAGRSRWWQSFVAKGGN